MRFVRFNLLFVLFLPFALAACSDNPVDDDHDDHAEAEGMALVINGVEVYRVLQGQVSCAQEPCGVTVSPGDETPLITVEFLDADGDEIHAEDLDDGSGLGYEIADETIAAVEQHAEDGAWRFHIQGLQAGTTRMQVMLMHGDHADFTTPPLSNPDAVTIRVQETR